MRLYRYRRRANVGEINYQSRVAGALGARVATETVRVYCTCAPHQEVRRLYAPSLGPRDVAYTSLVPSV